MEDNSMPNIETEIVSCDGNNITIDVKRYNYLVYRDGEIVAKGHKRGDFDNNTIIEWVADGYEHLKN